MEIFYKLSAWATVLLTANNDVSSGVITGGENASQASDIVSEGAEQVPTFMDGLMAMLPTIIIYGGVIFALYWFLFRPQRKKEKEVQLMRQGLRTGDNIVTSSGFYGKIVDVQDECFIIEFGTNKSISVPIRKSEIIAKQPEPPLK